MSACDVFPNEAPLSSHAPVSLDAFFDPSDETPERDVHQLARAMDYCREHPYTTLLVPPRVYRLTSPLARETQRKVMAGAFGANPQRVMFHPSFVYTRGVSFSGQRGTFFQADGAVFLVDGFMEPFSVRDCEDVTVRGFTVDHLRKPYSRGRVVSAEARPDGRFDVTVAFDPSCPVEEGTPLRLRYVLYSEADDLFFVPPQREVSVADAHTLRLVMEKDRTEEGEPYVGMVYYTLHSFHSRPAILIENAKNVKLLNVTIHSQPGMGVVGNRSENLLLRALSVTPSPGEHFSTNTDATHFTSIKGLLRLEKCRFEGQGDDFINVHNYYHTITRLDDTRCSLHTDAVDGTHAQSLDYPDVGDALELTRRDTMEVEAVYTVAACTPLPEENRAEVTLDHPLPEDCGPYLLADVTRLPRLEVVRCHARNHFARSILVKTRNVLLRDNVIEDAFGPGIVLAAESWWSEGVSPADVEIVGNVIRNSRRPFGEAGGIVVKTDCEKPEKRTIRNVMIKDNWINCPKADHGIFIRNAENVRLIRNHIVSKEEEIVWEP